MPKVVIPYSDLIKTAKQFKSSAIEVEKYRKELEKQMESVSSIWQDSESQPFYSMYIEWDENFSTLITLMKLIGEEVDGVAKRYNQVDK